MAQATPKDRGDSAKMRCDAEFILAELQSLADPHAAKGMSKYGIQGAKVYGISIPVLRKIARECKHNHGLALELWQSGVHEARILASMVDDPALVTESQMDDWVSEFDSWDLCDQCCMNLFDKTPFAYQKALEWGSRDREFEKRAGFALMACLAVHDKQAQDTAFDPFFGKILSEAKDERNYVRKAVNWALRQIGKRNITLHRQALAIADQLSASQDRTERWVGSDAMRELTNERTIKRLKS